MMNDSDIDVGILIEIDVKANGNKLNSTNPLERVPLEIQVDKTSPDQDQTEEYQKEYRPLRDDSETKNFEVGGRRTPEDNLNSCSHKDHSHNKQQD